MHRLLLLANGTFSCFGVVAEERNGANKLVKISIGGPATVVGEALYLRRRWFPLFLLIFLFSTARSAAVSRLYLATSTTL